MSITKAKGATRATHLTKGIIAIPLLSIKPNINILGGVPIGVIIPPILAPYAMAKMKRTLSTLWDVKNEAMGMSKRAVVVLERMELKIPDVNERERIIPRGVLGKRVKIFDAMTLCKSIFSVAMAKRKPPRKR